MPISAYASGSTLADGTEQTLSAPNVAGAFQLVVDLSVLAANDIVQFRAYQMVLTSGTSRVISVVQYAGVQLTDAMISISGWVANELTDANAVRFTMTQTAGTYRTFPWKVLQSTDAGAGGGGWWGA